FDNKTTGKLGVKYNFSNDLNIFSNAGTAYNVPTLYQLYAPATDWGNVGNANLTPETTQSYDIGFGYKDLKITYFHNTIEDMIDWNDGYENIDGESTFKGIEIAYKKDIFNDLLLSMNYTRLSAKDKDGKDLARRAKQTFKLGLDYYGIQKLHLGINGEYVGERKEYSWDGSVSAQTGRYTIANFVTNYEITKELKIYAKIDNITDKEYQTIEGYSTSPRAYYAGVKYSF
ncbi:MAG: TonB-dependent receptor, partial [Arcobacteraceae bacterium]